MRLLGWVCILLALLIGTGTFLYVTLERGRLERVLDDYASIPHADRYRAAAQQRAALTYLPGLLTSAGLAGFGILLLALRPRSAKEKRQPCPHCAEPILPTAKICPHCRTALTRIS